MVEQASAPSSREELQDRWKHLYQNYLPSLAKARDPVQHHWPVFLDHCFARIILDNAVGIDKPWPAVVSSPAVKNMSMEQLEAAIQLGDRLAAGDADLVVLDDRSLRLRGKKGKSIMPRQKEPSNTSPQIQKAKNGDISNYFPLNSTTILGMRTSPSN
jgi:hypothetical protein